MVSLVDRLYIGHADIVLQVVAAVEGMLVHCAGVQQSVEGKSLGEAVRIAEVDTSRQRQRPSGVLKLMIVGQAHTRREGAARILLILIAVVHHRVLRIVGVVLCVDG